MFRGFSFLVFLSSFVGFSLVVQGGPGIPKEIELGRETVLKNQGGLLSLRISTTEPVKIYVVGKEEAQLDLSQLKLKVRRLEPYPAADIAIDQQTGYFTLKSSLQELKGAHLEVTTEHQDKTEVFKLKMKTSP